MINSFRQSKQFSLYMTRIGWIVHQFPNGQFAYIKQFPLIGSFIKIPKLNPVIPFLEIDKIAKKYHAAKLAIEPNSDLTDKKTSEEFNRNGFLYNQYPSSATKTIYISLNHSPETIFDNFSSAKRRAIRKAIKSGIIIKEPDNLNDLMKIKGFLPFFLDFFQKKYVANFWSVFYPENASLLIAYYQNKPVAGILLVFHDKVSYYWQVRSSKLGKQLAAPSLLVYEALKVSKKRGCDYFDFEGIYDDRYPVKSWLGFTRFKQGFNGEEKLFLGSYVKNYNLFSNLL